MLTSTKSLQSAGTVLAFSQDTLTSPKRGLAEVPASQKIGSHPRSEQPQMKKALSWMRIYMAEEDKGKGLRFDATINAGHVLTFISLVVAGFVTWGVMDKRVVVLEEAQKTQKIIDASQDQSVRELRERTERGQEKLEQKLDRIIEMMQQRNR